MVMFFFSQWDVYFSGQLFLGPFNVTEAQFFMMAIHLAAFFGGADFWTRTATLPILGWTLPYSHFIVYLSYVLGLVSMYDFIRNVHISVYGKNNWGAPVRSTSLLRPHSV